MAVIEERTTAEGKRAYRVKVRLKGSPTVTATFDRKTDAKEWAKKTEAAIKEGRYFKTTEAKKHTVAELVDRYIEEILPRKPKSVIGQTRHLNWWKKELGHLTLADLTPATIIEARAKLIKNETTQGKKRSFSTVNRYTAALSHACSVAANEWEWMEESPVRKVKRLCEPRGRQRFLSEDERDRLLNACRESQSISIYPVVVLALSTGMRQGEILNLRWKDVDFKKRRILLEETKNNQRRSVPLVGHAYEVLKEHSKVRRLSSQLVFPSKEDPEQPIDLRRSWFTAIRRAKIEDFRFHDLRHSAASELAMNGVSMVAIAEILGHKTLQMVKRYAHLSESHTAEVLERMDEKIFREL